MATPGGPLGAPRGIEVDVQEAWKLLQEGALLVDVREAWELQQARVDVSEVLHVPLMELPRRAAEIPRDRVVLLFCQSGARSGHAARFLQQAGHGDAMNVQGGLVAWHRAGLPIRTP